MFFCWRQTVFWNLFGLVFAGELLFSFFYSNRFILYRYYHGRSNLALLGLKNLPLRPATKRCETPLQLHVVAAFNSRGEAVAVKLPAVCEDKDERSPKGLFRFTHVVATPEMFEWSVVALPFWRSLHVVQERIQNICGFRQHVPLGEVRLHFHLYCLSARIMPLDCLYCTKAKPEQH